MSQKELYHKIFGSENADEPVVLLKRLTKTYPYFSAAHYFLLRHTAEDTPEHAMIAGRTALHFNNPYRLNYLMHTDEPLSMPIMATGDRPGHDLPVEEVMQDAPQTEVTRQQREDTLLFEPLYTTDYFASQGIKLSEEVKPDDKLGKQLKSFTDWLKTMKKVHEQKLPAGSAGLDITVQNIADKSNVEEEILTESMADVFKEQGKTGKAREIYQKLSLLDPSKSAYFAAKIDSLKDL